MKWWLVLVAFVLGVLVTWLMTRRRDQEPISTSERPVPASEVDDASAFGGSPSEFSSEPGAAESWHRDADDEDALLSHESEPAAIRGDVEASVPPVAEATPNGDVAGVGEPRAVEAVDAVEVNAVEVDAETVPQPVVSQSAREPEQGAFTFDEKATGGGDGDGEDDAPSEGRARRD